jgi:hypothetical protein
MESQENLQRIASFKNLQKIVSTKETDEDSVILAATEAEPVKIENQLSPIKN